MSKVARIFQPLHRPIEFPPSSTEIHCCPPVLLSVLLSKVLGKKQDVGYFRGPVNKEKEPQPTKIATLSTFACNLSLIVGAIIGDNYKDNDDRKIK